MNKKYKILSLDGGGSWALIQILSLKERYKDKTGHQILKEYDMVVANSGGSIVLAALACNWTLDETVELFDKEELRKKIFYPNPFSKRYFPTGITKWFGFGPKYSTTKKYEAFNEIFKVIKSRNMDELPEYIGKSKLKIIVATFDSLNNKAKFFRSYSYPGKTYDKINLIKAVHASSNAPVNYFDFPAKFKAKGTEQFYYLWDGALGGFNNPLTAAMVEAFYAGVPKESIQVVSLGTGNKLMSQHDKEYFYKLYRNVLEHRKSKPFLGLKFFGKTVMNLAKTILYEPPDWANYVSYIMRFSDNLQNPEENIKQFIRLSPMIHVQPGFHDDNEKIKEFIYKLYAMDMDLSKQKDIEAVKQCFTEWKNGNILNQPVKGSISRDNKLDYSVGHKFFRDAFEDWKKI